MKQHTTCDGVFVTCIDFRLQKHIRRLKDVQYANKKFDHVRFAGASKNIEIIMDQIDISVRLHNISQVVLVQHEDCGAYGKKGTEAQHIKDLHRAKKNIFEKYPQLSVDLYYLHLDGSLKKIL